MSSVPPKTILPAILLANDLLDGDVVFWSGTRWSLDPADALIAKEADTATRLDAAGKAAIACQQVIDAYLVDVTVRADGIPVPNHFRERFKIKGPSIRPDLGKQALFAAVREV
jgi:hypothetical protein